MLKEKAKSLKKCPGVYIMKDKFHIVIYVGKSKSLRNRVSSYLGNIKNRTSKVEKLIKNIYDFDYIYVDTELEALLLEKELIDRYKPYYNRMLKNTKGYLYIEITLDEEYPRIILSEDMKSEKNLYFGPFTSKKIVTNGCESLNKCLKLRSCNRVLKSSCLDYTLNNCLGVCIDKNNIDLYYYNVSLATDYLTLKNEKIIDKLKEDMNDLSIKLEFEKALELREHIKNIETVKNELKNVVKIKNKEILLIEKLNDEYFKIFCIYNEIFYCEKYCIKNLDKKLLFRTIKSVFEHYEKKDYKNSKSSIDNILILNSYLKNERISYLEIKNYNEILSFLSERLE